MRELRPSASLPAHLPLLPLLILTLAAPVQAKPAHVKAMAEHYGPFMPAALNNCATCHRPSSTGKAPTSLAEFPHNLFGSRVKAVAESLRTAGKKTDIAARLRALAAEDSDRDGVPNEKEILTGHQPGSAQDRPKPAELAELPKKQKQFAAYQNRYRWRPFDPVSRPALPQVKNAAWVRNPIDAFLAAEHEKRGLKPRPPAAKLVLLRRVHLDLTGLSPTPEEQRAFLADPSPDAYEKVVDRLLASPHYGERWGRHWMDVWRYSDWAGYREQVRDSQPHIWRWRDWIVESLNADKGYDRMVQEMLAGDELAPEDPKVLPATGFLVRNYKRLSREKWMEDTVEHTSQAFLGVTLGCAKCHDHMYDPISQKEYYRFRAIFEPYQVRTDWVPGEFDTAKDGLPRAFDARADAPTYLYVRGDERQPVKDEPVPPGVPEVLGGNYAVEPVKLPLLARVPEKQPHVIAAAREDAAEKVTAARKALQECRSPEEASLAQLRLDAAEAARAALEAVLRVEQLEDAGRKDSDEWKQAAAETVRVQRRQAAAVAAVKRAEAARALEEAEKAEMPNPQGVQKAKDALKAAGEALAKAEAARNEPAGTDYKPRVTSSYPETSTGRRLALARWLTDRRHPLAARVAVNQIWMRHFGSPLVHSVSDFGGNGTPPTHPRLLDWLAVTFMDSGWSMKKLHRLIVTSSAYRMASTPDPANLAKDPDNVYLWRMNSRRMDAEIVRDNVLWVAGQLDTKLGGPDIDHHAGLAVKRRTIYFRHAAEKEMVFTSIFDGPSVVECYRRKETVAPQQALALANSELSLVQARLLARELHAKTGPDPAAFVRAAYERVLARPPKQAEGAECIRYLQEQSRRLATLPVSQTAGDAGRPSPDPALRAREHLVLVLLNHNDFIMIR